MKKVIATALVLLLSYSVAWADEDTKCNRDGNQSELNVCAYEDYQAADKKLNETWKNLMTKFKAEKTATAKLKAAQKAWIAFRDADVDAKFACEEGDASCWGSMESMLRSAELRDMTEARTAQLQKYIDEGLGGGL